MITFFECVNNPSSNEFTILVYRKRKYLLEIKESLLIKYNQSVLHKKISSTTLHLFTTTSLVNIVVTTPSVFILSNCLVHYTFIISNVADDGLKCHPKRCKQFFKKRWICRNSGSTDIVVLVCLVISQDHLTKGSCAFLGKSPSK